MLPHVRGRGGDSEPTTACLSEDVVVGFLDGTLAGAERERVELHVDACAACFGWLAAMIRSSLLQSRGVLADTLPLGDSPPQVDMLVVAVIPGDLPHREDGKVVI